MALLQKYFFKQALVPLAFAIAALSGLAILTQSLQTIDLIIENRQSALTFLYVTSLTLPHLIGIILPLAVFMATLFALNRLNLDSELAVSKAAGMSPWQVASPVLRIAAYAIGLHLLINLVLQPTAHREMREALFEVRTDVASQLIRPGEFTTPVPGLTVYAQDASAGGRLREILIYDNRSDADGPTTYIAKSGAITRNNGMPSLVLENGNVQALGNNGELRILNFEVNVFDLSEVLSIETAFRLKSSDRYLHELFTPDARDYSQRRYIDEFKAEGHARLATPLYNLALVLIALAALTRGSFQRMGYGRRIAIAGALGFFVRLVGFAVQSACEEDPSLNFLQYLVPIAVALIAGWWVFAPGRNRIKALKTMVTQDAS